jgi:predicted nucleic acid-binding protein
VVVVDQPIYFSALPAARKLIGKRDPDDVEILALALFMGIPLWSNDNDFEKSGVEWYTTAELLRKLSLSGGK